MKTMWRSVSVHGIAPLSFRFTMVGVSLVPHGHWYRFAPTVTYGVGMPCFASRLLLHAETVVYD